MIALGPDDVHVWAVALHAGADHGAIFSAEEEGRAARFVRPQDRDAFLAARGALRVLLGRYLEVPPGAIEFAAGVWGKPELAGALARTKLSFNLTHSGGTALIAVARDRPVGIDLERVRAMPEALGIARRVLGAAPAAALERLDALQRDVAFFHLWTAHEACIKALGLALAVAEQAVRVGWTDAGPVCEWADPLAAPAGLAVMTLAAVPGDAAALAWGRRGAAGGAGQDIRLTRFEYAASLADF